MKISTALCYSTGHKFLHFFVERKSEALFFCAPSHMNRLWKYLPAVTLPAESHLCDSKIHSFQVCVCVCVHACRPVVKAHNKEINNALRHTQKNVRPPDTHMHSVITHAQPLIFQVIKLIIIDQKQRLYNGIQLPLCVCSTLMSECYIRNTKIRCSAMDFGPHEKNLTLHPSPNTTRAPSNCCNHIVQDLIEPFKI